MRLQHAVTCSLILMGCVAAQSSFAGTTRQSKPTASSSDNLRPSGKGYGVSSLLEQPKSTGHAHNYAKPGGSGGSNGIFYNGGPVMLGGTHLYYIWYGNWSGNTAGTILDNLASSIGGSPYFNINTTYYDGSNNHVTNLVTHPSGTTDNYSQGTSLSDAQIQTVVSNAITSGRVASDTQGVYLVLTSADVTASSGFCTNYCGWHTHATIGGKDIKYGFIGNPDRCPSSCAAQTTSPNGNAGADGMASIISHELEEATSDPDLNAWYDRRGQENADKCAWTFGTESTASNGSKYNVVLGGKQYLIQRNWVNAAGGYCSMSF
jgi:hypothetical protein